MDRRISELFSLQELSYVLSESIQLDRVVEQVAKYAARFLQADGAIVVLVEMEGRALRVVAASGNLEWLVGQVSEDPESALYQDEVELLRDPTHRHIYTEREWIAFCEQAGLQIRKHEVVRKTHDFEPWLERGGEDAATQERVRARFREAPASAVRDLEIVVSEGRVQSFTDRKLVLAARR